MRDTTFSSKAYGTKEYKEITIEGRVQLDMLMAIQRDYKLSSYSLNSVSAHFLGEQKEVRWVGWVGAGAGCWMRTLQLHLPHYTGSDGRPALYPATHIHVPSC